MKVKNSNILKKGDVILIFSILILAGIIFIWKAYFVEKFDVGEKIAVIMHDGKNIERVNLNNLNNPVFIKIKDYNIVIIAEKGRIRFLQSDCPDKICLKSGYLTKCGDKAVCVPSRTQVVISGKDDDEIDSLSF
jgi:hypothetical protein